MLNYKHTIAKVIRLLFFLFLITSSATAQYVSLTKVEIKKLIILIKTDQSAQKQYSALTVLANHALTEYPNPVDTIVSEGHLANDPKKIITQKALADMDKIYALAYTYTVSNKPIYLTKSVAYVKAWAQTNHSLGNPINETKLDPLFEAYDLIKDHISNPDKNLIDQWLVRIADAEIANPRFKAGSKISFNNWNSHRIKILADVAYILNNIPYQKMTDTMIKKQIVQNLYATGSGIDFEERDALHYHAYTLEPLLKAAVVIKRATGFNYYTYVSPTGSSIQKSVNFLVPFATGEKTHAEFVNSKADFDRKRAKNNEPGYTIGANFNPINAIDALSFAAYFTPAYVDIVKKLMNTTDTYPNWQSVLNKVRKD